jgi:hypothetical protein
MALNQLSFLEDKGEYITEWATTPAGKKYPKKIGEFWTSMQRQMHSLHYVVSYRASFKPELPDYFIRRFTTEGDIVFDPFNGRGTTMLQANLLGRTAWGNDINPLSEILSYPKTNPVSYAEIEKRLEEIDLTMPVDFNKHPDLSMFYHPETFREIVNLKNYLQEHTTDADRFIQLIAISRLHGHSNGFFSVYSFPQISVPPENQIKINQKRNQAPDYRPVKPRILKKAAQALKSGKIQHIRNFSRDNIFNTQDSRDMSNLPSEKVQLIVTSPPFLDKADYILDNWLEFWFSGIDGEQLRGKIVQTANIREWKKFMKDSMREMYRILKPGGICVIEVGEVRVTGKKNLLNLDEVIVEISEELSSENRNMKFNVKEVMIQVQQFTKLANCFNVTNNLKGTNTQRLVVLQKE